MKIKFTFFGILAFCVPSLIFAQSPVSGFIKAKGEGSVTVSYFSENYSDVYLVPEKVEETPVFNEVTRNIVTLYAEYGISDRLNVVLNLPYINSKGEASATTLANNGFENERSGIQDLGIYGKYKIYTTATTNGTIDFIGAAGVKFPLGNYRADEGLQSIIAIGNRATEFTGLGIATYKNNSGIFATGQIGYSIKSDNIPNALISELKLGYAASKFYVDVNVANQLSDKDGVDILRNGFTGSFPLTRVNYTRIGLNAYVPIYEGFGISGGTNAYVAGRNLGKAIGYYAGLTYSF